MDIWKPNFKEKKIGSVHQNVKKRDGVKCRSEWVLLALSMAQPTELSSASSGGGKERDPSMGVVRL